MGSTLEGLKRGLNVTSTNAPILFQWVPATLGRIMDVLGRPIDEAGPVVTGRTFADSPSSTFLC